MKFKIPSSFKVACVDYEVVKTKNLGANDARRGVTSYFNRKIEIDPDQGLAEQHHAFLHEALHAIDNIFDTDLKETQIKRIASGYCQLIQQLEPEE